MSMFNNAQVLEAARIVRPILSEKLDATSAQEIDLKLSQLLNQSNLEEDTKTDRLLEVLDSQPQTKSWLDKFLQSDQTEKSYSPPAGDPELVSTTKYICPIGNDYTLYLENHREIPLCPTHLVRLVEENQS